MDSDNCRASESGYCLQVTHGYTLCRENECVDGDYDDMVRAALSGAGRRTPKRAARLPKRGRLPRSEP